MRDSASNLQLAGGSPTQSEIGGGGSREGASEPEGGDAAVGVSSSTAPATGAAEACSALDARAAGRGRQEENRRRREEGGATERAAATATRVTAIASGEGRGEAAERLRWLAAELVAEGVEWMNG